MSAKHVALIVVVAILTYGTRIAGLSMGNRTLPESVRQLFDRVPVAVFAALAVPGIFGPDVDVQPRVMAAFIALIGYFTTRLFWVGLIAGLLGYGVARWIF